MDDRVCENAGLCAFSRASTCCNRNSTAVFKAVVQRTRRDCKCTRTHTCLTLSCTVSNLFSKAPKAPMTPRIRDDMTERTSVGVLSTATTTSDASCKTKLIWKDTEPSSEIVSDAFWSPAKTTAASLNPITTVHTVSHAERGQPHTKGSQHKG